MLRITVVYRYYYDVNAGVIITYSKMCTTLNIPVRRDTGVHFFPCIVYSY